MNIVYWAHSYRPEDSVVTNHFGLLIQEAARFIVNWDPPSDDVNQSKLEQNLQGCDGMVGVLPWRSKGPSQYILFELGMALRARKPLLVFVDDRLPDHIIPQRILQRRYSHRFYFRQVREHTHALRELKTYMGEQPGPRYQTSFGQRTCGLLGLRALKPDTRRQLRDIVENRGYRVVELESIAWDNPLQYEAFEHLACLDVALVCADDRAIKSRHWLGAIQAVALPSIHFTIDPKFPFSGKFPKEFQPRQADVLDASPMQKVITAQFDLFEQEFLKSQDSKAIERYTRMQVQAGFLAGHYESNTRRQIMEVVMGDQYHVHGQAAGIGPGAHVHDVSFQQIWAPLSSQIDLAALAVELATLRSALKEIALTAEQDVAVGEVAAAETAAKKGDGPSVLQRLKGAGKWILDVAVEKGLSMAATAIKSALT